MVRKVMTYIECDRTDCGHYIVVECPQKLLGGYKMANYPKEWKETEQGHALCPKCKKEWEEEYKRFISNTKKKVTK